MEDVVQGARDVEVLRHVVADGAELRVLMERGDVLRRPGEEVVDAQDLVAVP